MGYPTKTSLSTAVKKSNLASFPGGISVKQINKHYTPIEPSIKGHLTQERQGIQSTQLPTISCNPEISPTSASNDAFPAHIDTKIDSVYVNCFKSTGKIFGDPTGRFIAPSIIGNNYILVIYNYDSNTIHPIAMPSRTKESLVTAYNTIISFLKSKGMTPTFATLDNETSDLLLTSLESSGLTINLVPPNLHRRNATERAIQTFKAHFIAILCGTDPKFPINLWDKLLPQAEITLNLLRNSRINPSLSAYCQVWGNFDYNKTPLAPLGTKLLVHLKPEVRETWAPRATRGWYLGPAMRHYRCYCVGIVKTQAERFADTVALFPTYVSIPTPSSTTTLLSIAYGLTQALLQLRESPPLPPLVVSQTRSLLELSKIFKQSLILLTTESLIILVYQQDEKYFPAHTP